ncbi:MAG: polymer-forming cytoskeletal protein [Spirochaetaceae bacterium]|jgi:cytoskeletal protein CcmA (bactofilin family)|nr:polymer-forming cytoskeletal protein [Spirochaetaceae bacterium]
MSLLSEDKPKEVIPVVTLSETTSLKGVLHFKNTVCIRGKFTGSIEAEGDLIVDKGATVEADHVYVNSLGVRGNLRAEIQAGNKVDLMTGAAVTGNISAQRLRIADGVLFEGKCSMINSDKDVEIFLRSTNEIKADLLTNSSGFTDEISG